MIRSCGSWRYLLPPLTRSVRTSRKATAPVTSPPLSTAARTHDETSAPIKAKRSYTRRKTPANSVDLTGATEKADTQSDTLSTHKPHTVTLADLYSSTLISPSRTSTTAHLWRSRQQPLASSSSQTAMTPRDSALSISLPFASDAELYDQYVRFDGGVRFGKILEDLDAFAGNIAYTHVHEGHRRTHHTDTVPPVNIVTAAVDRIVMAQRFPMDHDVVMRGAVTWIGTSSMEIHIEMAQIDDSDASKQSTILDAFFLMAARDPATGKAFAVAPLSLADMSASEVALFHAGEVNAKQRKIDAANSLKRTPPTEEEILVMHQAMMAADTGTDQDATRSAYSDDAYIRMENAVIRPKSVTIASTRLESHTMTQPQQRNMSGVIFGGFLMRTAYELARTTAYLFAGPKSHPFFVASDSITFLRPVQIGSVISMVARVTYSAGHPDTFFHIQVETHVRDLVSGHSFQSNTFEYTFCSPQIPLRRVRPTTYAEAMDHIQAKRLRSRQENIQNKQRYQQHTESVNPETLTT